MLQVSKYSIFFTVTLASSWFLSSHPWLLHYQQIQVAVVITMHFLDSNPLLRDLRTRYIHVCMYVHKCSLYSVIANLVTCEWLWSKNNSHLVHKGCQIMTHFHLSVIGCSSLLLCAWICSKLPSSGGICDTELHCSLVYGSVMLFCHFPLKMRAFETFESIFIFG